MKRSMIAALSVLMAIALLGLSNTAAAQEKQAREALVFLIAGQHYAQGYAPFSRETDKRMVDNTDLLLPGSTAAEIGLPLEKKDYPRSFIWSPGGKKFEQFAPGVNLLAGRNGRAPDAFRHGLELPIAHRLQKEYPESDIFIVKCAGEQWKLYHDWDPARKDGAYAQLLGYYKGGMADLEKRYAKVRILGLYWDQGNAYNNRPPNGKTFGKNLANLIDRLRKDTDPELQVFIRKHFLEAHVPHYRRHVIGVQVALCKKDPNCHLIDIDLGSKAANRRSWSYGGLYLSGRAYVEIANRIVDRDNLVRRARERQDGLPSNVKPAIVFLVAGQSNGNGGGVFRREDNIMEGVEFFAPTIPGTTAEELGLPLTTTPGTYNYSYIWNGQTGRFERPKKGVNLLAGRYKHGMEIPVMHRLEQQFPGNDIFIIKYARGGSNLFSQWKPEHNQEYGRFMGAYRPAMADLARRYPEVRVVGLYWDQGESDGGRGNAVRYLGNLTHLIACFRRDTKIPALKIFIRKHLFMHGNIGFKPVIDAQVAVAKKDPNAYLLDLDLGNNDANFWAWAWTYGNGHLSTKAFAEMTRRIFDEILPKARVKDFDLYKP